MANIAKIKCKTMTQKFSGIACFNAFITKLSCKSFTHIACLVFLICIIYANSLNVPFQWDEEKHIVNEPIIKDLANFIHPSKVRGLENYNFFISRYIAHLTFALNYRVNGLSVSGYHIVNIAIHIANTILVYFLVLLTFRTPYISQGESAEAAKWRGGVAFFSAMLFASHPLQTSAVTYVMQRFASLVSFFYLLSLVAYVKSRLLNDSDRLNGRGWQQRLFFYSVSFISAVLAMKTKENAFTLPFVIALHEFCFFTPSLNLSTSQLLRFRRKRFVYLAPIVFTLCIIPLTVMSMPKAAGKATASLIDPGSYMAGFTWSYSPVEYFLTQFRVIITYLRMLFLPVNLDIAYEYPVFRSFFDPQVLLSFIFLAALFGLGVYLLQRTRRIEQRAKGIEQNGEDSMPYALCALRLIGFGILWFFITLSVESIITTPRLIETYRTYLPSVGVCISVVTGIFLLGEKVRAPNVRQGVLVILVIVIGLLSVATYMRNEALGDSIKMWENTIKRFPRHINAHVRFGLFYCQRLMYAEAAEQYELAINLQYNSAKLHNDLGCIYQVRRMADKAIEQFKIALKFEPDDAEAHNNLAVVYDSINMPDEAIEQYLIAIKLKPDYAEAHYNLGVVFYRTGNTEKARTELTSALKIKPDSKQVQQMLDEISGKK